MNQERKHVYLYFGVNSWGSLKQRPQQIAAGLSTKNLVVYVNPIVDPFNARNRMPRQERGSKLLHFSFHRNRRNPNLLEVTFPSILPGSSVFEIIGEVGIGIFTEFLFDALRKRNIEPDVLWLSHPNQVNILHSLQSRVLCCYDCMDDYPLMASRAARMNRRSENIGRRLRSNEDKILSRADVVFATSMKLAESCGEHSRNVVRMPNGVDLNHFLPILDVKNHVSNPKLDRCVLRFFGSIGYWIDADLIAEIGEKRPDWIIRMIGPSKYPSVHSRLREIRNVELIGPVAYEHLQDYVGQFDVCILPFVSDELGQSINPVKMYEYLATGKPVVSTDIIEVRQLSPYIRIARNADEFISQIEASLSETGGENAIMRIQIARENSWSERVSAIERIVDVKMAELS